MSIRISVQPTNERMVSNHAQEGKEEGEVTRINPGHRTPVAGDLKGGIQ
jgi:hypothetical protein